MESILGIFEIVIREGFIYGILALGVYISNYILNYPDLTIEASFPLGACITSYLILSGCNPALALLIAFLCGGILGIITAILHTKLKINNILSSILVVTAGYSINLLINNGRSFIPFYNKGTIFSIFKPILKDIYPHKIIIISFVIIIIIKLILDLFFKTRLGLLLKATGNNKELVTSLGEDYDKMLIIGLFISNGLSALSGSVLSQSVESANINLGTGMIIFGITSVVIGINIFSKIKMSNTTKVIIGSIIYKLCLSIAMQLGIPTELLKLVMSIILIIILFSNSLTSNIVKNKILKKGFINERKSAKSIRKKDNFRIKTYK